MNGVEGLTESVKRAIRNVKKGYKTNAQRGRIVENGLKEAGTNKRVFLVEVSGSNRRYFCKAAVDVDTAVGRLVWFLPTAAVGSDGGLCDGGRGQAADRGVPGWDGDKYYVITWAVKNP